MLADILRDRNSGDTVIVLNGQGRHDFKITATLMNVVGQGECIVIPLQEGALYFTKEQAMEVFNLEEKK